ncbi:DNA protecting protein DprA [Gluconacetobacter diazotrophicus PA1 5]|uniref:DNA-protecting protein DprA n=1 Tax=Gluconacetobacter diazotrophicus TaxID=33996 RepID=A0A7W4I6P1_GLUDI|nr:DNA-processing protein DprA [Gluconacetobacter diazotrophicus]ACI51421.1 DNA protecting protein DprA [Gluconacetobacter diazotrophicus PA1 5]MBB2157270.1 DNA-protecting protein DprA [Gluconacetobacter diazotrophicus]TWB02470.1 DNA processing protein [Gluconacetobacter diazotrophicus]
MIPAGPLAARLRLARTEGVGPVGYRKLLLDYGDAERALAALPARARAAGRARALRIPPAEDIAAEIDGTMALGGRIIMLGDPDYPPLLAGIHDAPPALSVLGDAALLAGCGIAIVGARNASSNGARMAESLAATLASQGLTIISGLARGIDAAAHRGAMRAGVTIAAVAGGLDRPYPPDHAELQGRIAQHGVVVTETPLGTAPQSRHFPRRNRLIAGLALGCVVVEAALRSGSLITADLAAGYGRVLFAVPGSPLDARSRGSNALLRRGAILTESEQDVLAELPAGWQGRRQPESRQPENGVAQTQAAWPEPPAFPAPTPLSEGPGGQAEIRDAILTLLSFTPTPVDDLVRRCQFSTSAILTVLSELELAGNIETLPGGSVVLPSQPDETGRTLE